MLRHSLQRELPLEIPALEMVFAEPPSLDGLVVEVEPAREIDEPTMLESWELFVYENSPREAKGVVAEGHEVSLMCVAFEEGRVVPFTARSGLMMRAGDDATLPDLAKSLVGKRVGERYVTKVVVPDDFEQDPRIVDLRRSGGDGRWGRRGRDRFFGNGRRRSRGNSRSWK